MPRSEYGMDPLEILLRREQCTCKGCAYIDRIRIVDVERQFCRLTDAPAVARCGRYVEVVPKSTGAR